MVMTWASVLFIKLSLTLEISNNELFWHAVSFVNHFSLLAFLVYSDFVSLLLIQITTPVEGLGY